MGLPSFVHLSLLSAKHSNVLGSKDRRQNSNKLH